MDADVYRDRQIDGPKFPVSYNSRENRSGLIQVIMYTTSKRIELESPASCSGVKFL